MLYKLGQSELAPMDLIHVDLAPFYRDLAGQPEMATFVPYAMSRLGDNMAESFNERQIHVVNQIMTADRCLISSRLLEYLAVLRMNSCWMESMRSEAEQLLPLLSIVQPGLRVEVDSGVRSDSA